MKRSENQVKLLRGTSSSSTSSTIKILHNLHQWNKFDNDLQSIVLIGLLSDWGPPPLGNFTHHGLVSWTFPFPQGASYFTKDNSCWQSNTNGNHDEEHQEMLIPQWICSSHLILIVRKSITIVLFPAHQTQIQLNKPYIKVIIKSQY